MGVFRHDDVGPDVKVQLVASPIDSLDQPLAAAVLAQKRLAAKAGEGESVGIAGSVVPFAGLAMGHGHGLGAPQWTLVTRTRYQGGRRNDKVKKPAARLVAVATQTVDGNAAPMPL
jgi:hypothetical protein